MSKTVESKERKGRPVTSVDVARFARVSQSTVSRVFNGAASIAPETRAHVLDASKKLGYRPNAIARGLISSRTNIIALLIMQNGSPFYHHLVDILLSEFRKRNYNVMVVRQLDNEAGAEMLVRVQEYRVDGIVVTAVEDSGAVRDICEQSDAPIVLLNRYITGVDVDIVCCDNYSAGVMVSNFFQKNGYHSVACLLGDERALITRDRVLGIQDGSESAELSIVDMEYGRYTYESGCQMCRQMMQRLTERPDVVFCAADVIAFGAIDTLRYEYHLRVPEDISVMGFNDIPETQWMAYNLTTVRQPYQELVDSCVDLLSRRIESRNAPTMKIQHSCAIVERGTTKRKTAAD